MPSITKELLTRYQQTTFKLSADTRLRTENDAIDFVNERGFIFFWPFKSVHFPSLWSAVAGNRPVADQHDDPGHITWNWKDKLLDKRVWYYARIIKKKNTFVSLDTIPYFYALSPNYGEPEADFQDQYDQGLVPLEAKLIFDALMKKGPLDTISLRKEAHLSGPNSQSPFNRALEILQQQLKILPVAVSEAGAWNYAFVYDLTHRYYPDLLDKARKISENAAMDQLITMYFRSLGASQLKQVNSFFNWPISQTEHSINRLLISGALISGVTISDSPGEYLCLPELIDQ